MTKSFNVLSQCLGLSAKKNLVGAFSEYCVPRNFVGTFSSWAPVCPHPAGASSGLRLRVASASASLAVASIECVCVTERHAARYTL